MRRSHPQGETMIGVTAGLSVKPGHVEVPQDH